MNEDTLIAIERQLVRIADSLERIAENSERIEISGAQVDYSDISNIKLPTAAEMSTGPKYKEHSEIGKGPVMEKTCGQEVCRCLRNDGSCAAHHPEFCQKCRKLNRI